MKNSMSVKFDSLSQNEMFARICISAFIAPLNPNIEELNDIKTAVSEAVTNAIVHGYGGGPGIIEMTASIVENNVKIQVIDDGCGIEDIDEARKPFFTTCGDGTRSGMGFTVMENFMDTVMIASAPEEGTRVLMEKQIKGATDE